MSDLFKGVDISWKPFLEGEFQKDYMKKIKRFLVDCSKNNQTIYPHPKNIFRSLELTSYENVKVVVLGQDPYHGVGQAHGLSFSVMPDVDIPPSLQNIYKELTSDINFKHPGHGSLDYWASQGVLLLNSILTVEHGKAGSHQGRGWEKFTDRIIGLLNEGKDGLVFLLWGAYAQRKGEFIDRGKHLVLTSPHPSPFSAHKGFFGSRPFSKINEHLIRLGKQPIDWQIP